ncbi:MAG: hypothetical protein GVY12_09625 [Bacteroidetes bacterium]|nr:hypothetical protein [Bacteroidota bacterium]
MNKTQMYYRLLALGGLALLLSALCMLSPQTALAQSPQTLVIENDVVYINGRAVPDADLPASLDLSGVDARFSFTGSMESVVEINGRVYRVQDNTLSDMRVPEDRQGRVAVYFREQPEQSDLREVRLQVGQAEREGPIATPAFAAMRHHTEAVQTYTRTLLQLVGQRETGDLEATLEQLQRHASRLARFSEDLPRFEMQSYLEAVQQSDQELHSRLIREQELEAQTEALAREVSTAEGEEQEVLRRELRAQLEEIFEMKQENRAREIQQLQEEMERLRQRLEKRERYREHMIERRLRYLLRKQGGDGP